MARRVSDLYALVAGEAVDRAREDGKVFEVTCNCGGRTPLIGDQPIRCPLCLRSIGVVVVAGDPGYVLGADPSGASRLLPVQGSTAAPIGSLAPTEYQRILDGMMLACPDRISADPRRHDRPRKDEKGNLKGCDHSRYWALA